jgi:acetyltransferase-like isoleucine patch superfamily enzyme
MVIKRIKRLIKKLLPRPFFDFIRTDSKITCADKSMKEFEGKMHLDKVELYLGRNITFDAIFNLSHSKVHVGNNCTFRNVYFYVSNNSEVFFGDGCIFSPPSGHTAHIVIDNGRVTFEGYNNINAHILVRFGGEMKVGKYAGIGYDSEIRCENFVQIGSYGLFSYDVCIYDTDTHSTEWEKRRERIESGYPFGANEVERPNTKPVIIGDDVWLGKGVTITKGAQLGDRCIVGIRTTVGGGIYDCDTTIVSNKPRVINKKPK